MVTGQFSSISTLDLLMNYLYSLEIGFSDDDDMWWSRVKSRVNSRV